MARCAEQVIALTGLRTLHSNVDHMQDDGALAIAAMIDHQTALLELHIVETHPYCGDVREGAALPLAGSIAAAMQMQHLRLHNLPVGYPAMEIRVHQFQHFTGLQTLDVEGSVPGGHLEWTLFDTLKRWTFLQHLNLSSCNLPEETMFGDEGLPLGQGIFHGLGH